VNAQRIAVACVLNICVLCGSIAAFGQNDGVDIRIDDLKARIKAERSAILELKQRQSNAEHEKLLLTTEIDQEVVRISKLNRLIERAPRHARVPALPEIQESTPAANTAKQPALRPARPAPVTAVPSVPSSVPQTIDAESQAEIDRLSAMKKDLILEKSTLEQVVK